MAVTTTTITREMIPYGGLELGSVLMTDELFYPFSNIIEDMVRNLRHHGHVNTDQFCYFLCRVFESLTAQDAVSSTDNSNYSSNSSRNSTSTNYSHDVYSSNDGYTQNGYASPQNDRYSQDGYSDAYDSRIMSDFEPNSNYLHSSLLQGSLLKLLTAAESTPLSGELDYCGRCVLKSAALRHGSLDVLRWLQVRGLLDIQIIDNREENAIFEVLRRQGGSPVSSSTF